VHARGAENVGGQERSSTLRGRRHTEVGGDYTPFGGGGEVANAKVQKP